MIPGLLQTQAYARALFDGQLPPLDDLQIEERWSARAERRRLLRERPNTAYSFILEEHLFLRRTGGVEVTRELIDHPAGKADRPRTGRGGPHRGPPPFRAPEFRRLRTPGTPSTPCGTRC